MAFSRRSFVRTVGLGSLGAWTAPLLPAGVGQPRRHLLGSQPPAPTGQLRLCYNENPVGPGQAVLDALQDALARGSRYPFAEMVRFRQALIGYLGLPEQATTTTANTTANTTDSAASTHAPTSLVVGAGSTEILRSCVDAFTGPDRPLVTGAPSFDSLVTHAMAVHTPVRAVPVDGHLRLDLDAMLDQVHDAGMVYVCNPNNPTATIHDAHDVREFITRVNGRAPQCMVVVDEAYLDYASDPGAATLLSVALMNPTVVVTRTFSKAFGMAGLRLGYAVGRPETIAQLELRQLSLGENILALTAGTAALEQAATHLTDERARNREAREFTRAGLAEMGVQTEPSSSNFIFVPVRREAVAFSTACAQRGVMVGRPFPPLTTYSRITIGTMDDMRQAIQVFKSVLSAV